MLTVLADTATVCCPAGQHCTVPMSPDADDKMVYHSLSAGKTVERDREKETYCSEAKTRGEGREEVEGEGKGEEK